jgi:hypothetical protein
MTVLNYRSLKRVEHVPLGDIAVIVGKNDVGKSNFLNALEIFFNGGPIGPDDLTRGVPKGAQVEIEVAFCEIKAEDLQKLSSMHFLTQDSELIVRKKCPGGSKQPEISLYVYDFEDPSFRNLFSKKEEELNRTAADHGLDFTRSGRSITNEEKITELWRYASSNGLAKVDSYVTPDKESWKIVESTLPGYHLFPSELNLKIERAEVQSPFQGLVDEAAKENEADWNDFRVKVEAKVAADVKKIEQHLLEQTDSAVKLVPRFDFGWKGFTLKFDIEDASGASIPLENRGMGIRRLVMVSFLRYLAEKTATGSAGSRSTIFGIEEPETSLHPSAQRNLIESFRVLRNAGNQIIMSSHSPVFVAEARHDNVVLVRREAAETTTKWGNELDAEVIVDELGIEPRDQLGSFNACVFVEGIGDEVFYSHIAKKFKDAKLVESDFAESHIGFLPVGGNNLRFFVDRMHMKKINRRFGVVVDSNRDSAEKPINQVLLDWQGECTRAGGKFFILKKREIENYLHPAAIKKVTGRTVDASEYANVKGAIGANYSIDKHLKPILEAMSCQDILEMDKYTNGGGEEKHELLEIIAELLHLCSGPDTTQPASVAA